MDKTSFEGSTSEFIRVQNGEVLKYPRQIWKESRLYDTLTRDIETSFSVECQILEHLGHHPRIVKYLGRNQGEGDPRGILLAEASHGDLQRYLDQNEAVEAVAYIHHRGVVHADLRPENFLIHETTLMSLDLWLCDFGGSKCDELGVYGGHLPDSGFFDPTLEPSATTQMDIFSIGSVLYAILTGHWPFRGLGVFKSPEEMNDYGNKVDNLFLQGTFPDVDELFAGDIIMKCWKNEYASAENVLQSLQAEMDRAERTRFWLAEWFDWVRSMLSP
ncbi:kinase [Hirsutella rhossiliensis]|uniref:EKC/KEOPS complex subunit BUD32 n=1 Tax=Hirsutella rhossiliensis TaxID=111463 RepID=A0A9P8MZ94_9HYPO|nr:kinase [Hirsutella rhossiliensis]KAH0961842.1 kinase [Hirsutella rhossiliensis]